MPTIPAALAAEKWALKKATAEARNNAHALPSSSTGPLLQSFSMAPLKGVGLEVTLALGRYRVARVPRKDYPSSSTVDPVNSKSHGRKALGGGSAVI